MFVYDTQQNVWRKGLRAAVSTVEEEWWFGLCVVTEWSVNSSKPNHLRTIYSLCSSCASFTCLRPVPRQKVTDSWRLWNTKTDAWLRKTCCAFMCAASQITVFSINSQETNRTSNQTHLMLDSCSERSDRLAVKRWKTALYATAHQSSIMQSFQNNVNEKETLL